MTGGLFRKQHQGSSSNCQQPRKGKKIANFSSSAPVALPGIFWSRLFWGCAVCEHEVKLGKYKYKLRCKFKACIETKILADCVINPKVILKKSQHSYKFVSAAEGPTMTLRYKFVFFITNNDATHRIGTQVHMRPELIGHCVFSVRRGAGGRRCRCHRVRCSGASRRRVRRHRIWIENLGVASEHAPLEEGTRKGRRQHRRKAVAAAESSATDSGSGRAGVH